MCYLYKLIVQYDGVFSYMNATIETLNFLRENLFPPLR